MSFTDSAADVLDRTEASLNSLIVDALKAKSYREIGVIAAMAEAVAAISVGRSREGKRSAAPVSAPVGGSLSVSAPQQEAPAAPKAAAEPSWMRPKTS